MKQRYLPTGNEWVSLPTVQEQTAALESFSFLHMGSKGLIEQRGKYGQPLMQPFFQINGTDTVLASLSWNRESDWIPRFQGKAGSLQVNGLIFCPIGQRGFIYRLTVCSRQACRLSLGLRGNWSASWHCINEDKPISGIRQCYRSAWNGSLIFDMRCGLPLFAFAPMADVPCRSCCETTGEDICYQLVYDADLTPGEPVSVTFYWGLGFEEVAAATSAKEMLRQGWQAELRRTIFWLDQRRHPIPDPRLDRLYHTNLFFCLFYSTGRTLDTEELVLVTSRSPRYYVSAAYWDRDSLLWSFPAILDADPTLAREMLDYVFGRQRRNIGIHSRYIDGTILEPGFELDELVAPVLALEQYIARTGDQSYLCESPVRAGISLILSRLKEKRHPDTALYETFLQPTDDVRSYPYLTYDNVLVWKALKSIAHSFPSLCPEASQEAEAVRAAILRHCVVAGEHGDYFAWSTDLTGHTDVYDEPPGSLLLLPYLGFCSIQDDTYQNTVRQIRAPEYPYSFADAPFAEIGCAHAPHPWMLSVANSLLSGKAGHALDILRRAEMDNGIVCESIDENTGASATGDAFATCAGFVCYALRTALKEHAYEE